MHYAQIERWWEIVSSAYLMVSLQFYGLSSDNDAIEEPLLKKLRAHSYWQSSSSWTSRFHNLQMLIQPYICFCLLKSWLAVFEIPQLERGFSRLIAILNQFLGWQNHDLLAESKVCQLVERNDLSRVLLDIGVEEQTGTSAFGNGDGQSSRQPESPV